MDCPSCSGRKVVRRTLKGFKSWWFGPCERCDGTGTVPDPSWSDLILWARSGEPVQQGPQHVGNVSERHERSMPGE